MKMLRKWAATVAIPVALTGCAGTELHQEAVTSNDLHEARRQMDSAPLPVLGASRVDEPDEALGDGRERSVPRIAGPMPGTLRLS